MPPESLRGVQRRGNLFVITDNLRLLRSARNDNMVLRKALSLHWSRIKNET